MTKQSSEIIEYKGKEYLLYSYHLRSYLDREKIRMRGISSYLRIKIEKGLVRERQNSSVF